MRTPNQNLTESFPELKEAFHYLKVNDPHFQEALKQYEKLEAIVHKVDHEDEVMSDFELETIKKQRVMLKDQLYDMLKKCKSSMESQSLSN